MNKQQALEKIEELKNYVAEEDKKEEKTVGIAIKTIWGGLRFQSTKTTIKEAVIEAVASDANLRDADLSGANLSDANLSGADLSGAELNRALFYGRGGTKELKKSQLPAFLAALGFVIIED